MATSLLLMSKLTAMLIMVILGIIIVRMGVVKEEDTRPLSAIVVYVLQPAMIIHAMQLELTPERLRGFIFSIIFSTAVYVIWIVLTIILKKPLKLMPVDQATMIYSNVGNMSLPVVAMVLGDEMVFYVGALQIPFNLFLWTHGTMILSGQTKPNIKKLLVNSNLIALWVGLLITAFGIEMPDVIDTTLTTLNNAVAPISMLVVGMVIANSSFRQMFVNVKAYLLLAGRLIIFPLIIMVLLFFTGIMKRFPEFIPIAMAIFIAFSAPPASMVSQLAVLYDEQPREAGIYNTMGMFLCLVTMPLMMFVYQFIFGV